MNTLLVIQIIISVFLIGAILLQAQGSGLGIAFGGSSSSYHTKRGVEKTIFITTIILAALFAILSIVALV